MKFKFIAISALIAKNTPTVSITDGSFLSGKYFRAYIRFTVAASDKENACGYFYRVEMSNYQSCIASKR